MLTVLILKYCIKIKNILSTYILILKDNFYISLIDLKKKENMKNLNEEIGFVGYLTYTLKELTFQEKMKNNSSRHLMIFFQLDNFLNF